VPAQHSIMLRKLKSAVQYGLGYKLLAIAYSRYQQLKLTLTSSYRTYRFYILYDKILRKATIGHGARVMQRVDIKGPGRVVIGENVRFGYPMSPFFRRHSITIITKFPDSEVTIGDECTIGNNNKFVVVKKIVLGKRCKTGHNDQFYDSDLHSVDKELRHRSGDLEGFQGDIQLADNVMIGSDVLLGPNITVGQNCVIGKGAVLKNRVCEEDMIIVGNPARPVSKIPHG